MKLPKIKFNLNFGKRETLTVLLLRFGMGWVMLYSGISKIVNPYWTAAPYLESAHHMQRFFLWLASPENIVWVDFINKWGVLLIGIALIIGFAVRYASWFGILAMLLYYLPALEFPYVALGKWFLVSEHIIFALVFFELIGTRAGEVWGVDRFLKDHHILARRVKKTGKE
ncbi:hypothetical protein A2110_02360 [Candidatus Jorgensenbacteria bacterium GWA1_54_12]|uniref:DoxX family protein n=1 Tax=Candidatus Jorgensenbacteria bacterium GWA1_54_12 TaxID=1798468 RepID=A0A1F6BKV0_9BACT|nr:MAG: hypothetical protein A2110_02360 [Candidatus Jorgensenbacteria bacterium GWA1_54_12]